MFTLTVRIDTATRRIKPGYVSACGPFTNAPDTGESDVVFAAPTADPPAHTDGRAAWRRCRLTPDLSAAEVDPSLVPSLSTDADRFDAERWLKATNLYWLDVVTQLVAGLNQVRQNPTTTYSAVTAPTIADVKAGVIAKYQALG